ncbi:MAG TPA: hypothetical protein VIJ15_06935 [Dermatophilaceae bacterium]
MATPTSENVAEPVTKLVTTQVAEPVTKLEAEPARATEHVSAAGIPAFAQKSREQLVSGLQQGRQFSVDAAESWVMAVSTIPAMNLFKIPGLPDLQTATTYAFDIAADLLDAQRAFAMKLTKVLVP